MSITTTWIVEQMNCYPTSEGQTDVVFNVAWRVNATDGTFYATAYGTAGVTYEAGSPYTPYADLTQAQVIGWVQGSMGAEQVASIERHRIAAMPAHGVLDSVPNQRWQQAQQENFPARDRRALNQHR